MNGSITDPSERSSNVTDTYFFVGLGEDGCPLQQHHHVDYTQISAVHGTLILAYVLVILMAIFGNMLVIWTVWRNVHMHTVTNYYIVNLAISDFLVSLIVMPLKLLEFTSPCKWHIFSTDSLCAFMSYVLPIFVFVSVLTLVAISLERYVIFFFFKLQKSVTVKENISVFNSLY